MNEQLAVKHVRRGRREMTVSAKHFSCLRVVERDLAREHLGRDGLERQLEGRGDAEIAAAAA